MVMILLALFALLMTVVALSRSLALRHAEERIEDLLEDNHDLEREVNAHVVSLNMVLGELS